MQQQLHSACFQLVFVVVSFCDHFLVLFVHSHFTLFLGVGVDDSGVGAVGVFYSMGLMEYCEGVLACL